LPWWKKWTYCNGLQTTKRNYLSHATWWSLIDVWMEIDNKILEYLYCPDPYNIGYYLNMIAKVIINKSEAVSEDTQRILDKYTKMQINNRVNSFLLTIAKHTKNSIALQYILTEFIKIKPR